MLNSQSGQMGVCNQIGDSLTFLEHLLKDNPMSFGRADDSRTRLVEPALYAGKRLFERKRVLEDPWVGRYPNKCA